MSEESRHGVEVVDYEVIKSDGDIEIRKYKKINIVEIGTYRDRHGNSGFMELFNYIQGNNESNRKIPMTAPVINEMKNGNTTMAFVMPSNMSHHEIPKPKSDALKINEISSGYFAVLSFSGLTNYGKVERKMEKLIRWLKENNVRILSNFYLARFDPPFTIPVRRKNEMMVRIEYIQEK